MKYDILCCPVLTSLITNCWIILVIYDVPYSLDWHWLPSQRPTSLKTLSVAVYDACNDKASWATRVIVVGLIVAITLLKSAQSSNANAGEHGHYSLTRKEIDRGTSCTIFSNWLVILPDRLPNLPLREQQQCKLSLCFSSKQILTFLISQAKTRSRLTLRKRKTVVHVKAHACLCLNAHILRSLTRFIDASLLSNVQRPRQLRATCAEKNKYLFQQLHRQQLLCDALQSEICYVRLFPCLHMQCSRGRRLRSHLQFRHLCRM